MLQERENMFESKRSITQLARDLRRSPTDSEVRLWKLLRRKQLNGYKFVRQKPLIYEERNRIKSFFITDFYCSRLKLVIEVDGKIHEYQKYYDQQRDNVIRELGLEVLRIKNEEISNLNLTRIKILDAITEIESNQITFK